MIDNINIDQMRNAVKIINRRAVVEASGNVNIHNVAEVVSTGVDIISI